MGWSEMFRYSGLAWGSLLSVTALALFVPTGGWYALIIGLLFAVETMISLRGVFEAAVQFLLSVAGFLILRDFKVHETSYILLTLSLVWLGTDMIFERISKVRTVARPVRLIGAGITALNVFRLLSSSNREAPLCFGVYTLFFAAYTWLYKEPILGFASTTALPLAVFFALGADQVQGWLFALIAIAVFYYAAGYLLRRVNTAQGWNKMFLFSGL